MTNTKIGHKNKFFLYHVYKEPNFMAYIIMQIRFYVLSWYYGASEVKHLFTRANISHEPRSGSRAICLFRPLNYFPLTQKKTHFLHLQCFKQIPFLKFSEKRYKFKIPKVTGTYPHLMYWSLRMWLVQLPNYLLTVVSSGIGSNVFFFWFNEGNTKLLDLVL